MLVENYIQYPASRLTAVANFCTRLEVRPPAALIPSSSPPPPPAPPNPSQSTLHACMLSLTARAAPRRIVVVCNSSASSPHALLTVGRRVGCHRPFLRRKRAGFIFSVNSTIQSLLATEQYGPTSPRPPLQPHAFAPTQSALGVGATPHAQAQTMASQAMASTIRGARPPPRPHRRRKSSSSSTQSRGGSRGGGCQPGVRAARRPQRWRAAPRMRPRVRGATLSVRRRISGN